MEAAAGAELIKRMLDLLDMIESRPTSMPCSQ
jgi:hypothetical protein